VPPYGLMYRFGLVPWERRDVEESWKLLFDQPDAPAPGRALDVGCGSGRDAVYLARRGWQVTAVDFVDEALAKAKERAAEAGAPVQWVKGDVGKLGELGLDPGYTLLYDFGCLHGLPDDARRGAAAGLNQLAAPGATLLLGAFMRGRRVVLPTGMDQEEIVALLGDGWQLEEVRSGVSAELPRPIRKAEPMGYRLTRRG
jgi:SAM-dependent methyltransferase